MNDSPLLHHQDDGILTVTFNRPDKYNAITTEMLDRMAELAVEFRENDDLRVMLINAKGKYYSAGMDMSAGLTPETGSGIFFRNWYRKSFHLLFDELEAIEKPVISAAQGPCLGGALEMALSCDFRLAAESASYGLPETVLGGLPGSGGTSRLTRIVGTAEAKWMIMAAKTVNAERALRTGLVHEIYPDDAFAEKCREFALHLTTLPREVLGMAKLAIEAVKDLDRATARNVERMANTPLSQSKEHRDLINAFLNRKKKS